MSKRKSTSWALKFGMATAGWFAAFSVGCGAAPNGSYVLDPGAVSSVTCPAGQSRFGNACAASFEQACYSGLGYMLDANTCKSVTQLSYTVGNRRLNPGDSAGVWALDTGVRLYAGDKLTIYGSGGWGSVKTGSTLWGLVNWYSTTGSSCSRVSVSGEGTSYNGLPSMLLGTDGVEVFQIGSGTTRIAPRAGMLRIGLNVPDSADLCATAVASIQVSHCETRNGQLIPCP